MAVAGTLVGRQSESMQRSPSTEPDMLGMAATRSLAHLIDFFVSLKQSTFFTLIKNWYLRPQGYADPFPTGSTMSVTIPAVPQVRNCVFDTLAEVVVTENIFLSCRPVQLNWLEVWEVLCQTCPIQSYVSGALYQGNLHLTEKYYEDDLVLLQGPEPAYCVHQNVTVFFKNIRQVHPGISPFLLGPFSCSLLMFTYKSIRYSVSQVLGLLVLRGDDSRLFSSIISSDDLLFLSIIFFWVYHIEDGSHSTGKD